MPLRHVADQFKSKWRRSTTKTNDMHTTSGSAAAVLASARTSIDVDSCTKQRHPLSLSSGQKQARQSAAAPVPVTTNNNQPSSSQQQPAPNPDYALDGIGEYVFLEQLGHGKFSKVMLAQHYQTGDKYAVKVIHTQFAYPEVHTHCFWD